jgi:hypothetical protein
LPRLHISGDDEEAFLEILQRSFGLNPRRLQELTDRPIWKGFVEAPTEQRDALMIDLGVESPPTLLTILEVERLRAQLVDGIPTSLQDIVEKFGLLQDFPLELRVISCDELCRRVEVELSDAQRDRFQAWRRLPFDRIIVQDVVYSEISDSLRKTGLARDVADLESLSLGTHDLVCKLGTDGQGLVRRLGSELRAARLHVFHPDFDRNELGRRDINLKSRSANIRARYKRKSGRKGAA